VIAHAPHDPRVRLPDGALQADAPTRWLHADGYAWLIAPLPVPELFYVLRTTPDQQSRPEWRIAAQLATLLGQHERFHREMRALKRLSEQRLTALGTLYETAIASERGGLEHFLQLATRRAAQAMEAQACTLMLLDEATQTLSIAASYGLPDKLIAEARVPLGEGVAGQVALTGEPMLLGELDAEPSLRHLPRRAEISSSICVPLRNQENAVIGVLAIRRLKPAPAFTQEDLRLFVIFANQIANALENARLYQRLKQNVGQLTTLVELTQLVTAVLDVDALLQTVARQIREKVGFARCAVFLSGESARVYQPRLIEGYRAEMFPARGFRKGQGVIGMVAKLRLPLVVTDAQREVQPMRGFGRALGTNRYCALPIVVHGGCIGVVLADNHDEPFRPEQVELLSAFVNQAGIALENARLYREMERRYQEIQELAAFRNNILRSLSSGMFTVDEQGVITTWNRAAQRHLGFSARESVGRPYAEVLHAPQCPIAPEHCQQLREAIREVLHGAGGRALYKTPVQARVLNFTVSPLITRGRQTQGAVVLFEDITEYLHLEARLHEMERLATVGQMTATIAHELRNPLTALARRRRYADAGRRPLRHATALHGDYPRRIAPTGGAGGRVSGVRQAVPVRHSPDAAQAHRAARAQRAGAVPEVGGRAGALGVPRRADCACGRRALGAGAAQPHPERRASDARRRRADPARLRRGRRYRARRARHRRRRARTDARTNLHPLLHHPHTGNRAGAEYCQKNRGGTQRQDDP
jgi:PAS domain S-box-containing protein